MAGNSLIETIDGEPVLGELATQILSADNSTPVAWDAVRDQLQMFDPNPTQGRMLLFESEKEAHHERIKLDELRREYFSATPKRRKQLKPEIMAQERQIVAASLREKADTAQAVIDEMGRRAALANGRLKAADERKLSAATDKLARLTRLQEDMAKPEYTLPFFLYRLHFSEVFERKGGFDIVVANPPYVRGDILGNQKAELQASYPQVFFGKADIYVYFFVRSYQLLKNNGQLVFITSNKYLQAKFASGLRQFLRTNVLMQSLINFGDLPVFDVAAYPCILVSVKAKPQESKFVTLAVSQSEQLENLREALAHNSQLISQSDLSDSGWRIVSTEQQRILGRVIKQTKSLREYIGDDAFYGIKTGHSRAFIIDEIDSIQTRFC